MLSSPNLAMVLYDYLWAIAVLSSLFLCRANPIETWGHLFELWYQVTWSPPHSSRCPQEWRHNGALAVKSYQSSEECLPRQYVTPTDCDTKHANKGHDAFCLCFAETGERTENTRRHTCSGTNWRCHQRNIARHIQDQLFFLISISHFSQWMAEQKGASSNHTSHGIFQ